jgi:para-aminobenzoate synthetase/4-amino-4-deoxychorismate lyase
MILLDDVQSTTAKPTSRLYKQTPTKTWCVTPVEDQLATLRSVECALDEISKALAQGQYVVAAFAYELGYLLHRISPKPITEGLEDDAHPLVLAWSFDHYESLSKDQVDDYLKQALRKSTLAPNTTCMAGIAHIKNSITEEQFAADLQTIQEYIRNGDAYQINHTYRVTGQAYGEPLALYMRLRDRQPGRYGAFIEDGTNYILSQSPELFIECRDSTLKAMPMKGTANAISLSPSQLADDPKNQAENVMIVDLLRNDLSRLAVLGSVKVPHLFEVARYGDVLQMTSTVEATAKPGLCLIDVLTAIFPCGSVTGAPKKRSMEIIQELEATERGFYCGAVGWLDPNGDFSLSVPIRTVALQKNPSTQASIFTLGIGAGITYGSNIDQEWQECNLKAEFLTALPSATNLFETILIKNRVAQHLAWHLQRLESSANTLCIALSIESAQRVVQEACVDCDKDFQYRLRLNLASDGTLSYQIATLDPLTEKVKIFWASDLFDQPAQARMHSGNILLQHKVSHREIYDRAWQLAVSRGGFDALFTNEQGFVTEGGRSSVFIKPKGSQEWLTPPLSAGVLPGVMRSIILKDPKWNAREANLSVADLVNAEEIMLSNALRGTISAYF